MVCKRLVISGVVQGVGFRANCFQEASRIGKLKGWVRNLPTGEVEVLVQGEPELVSKLVLWCGHGPSTASVEHVSCTEVQVDPNLGAFTVRK